MKFCSIRHCDIVNSVCRMKDCLQLIFLKNRKHKRTQLYFILMSDEKFNEQEIFMKQFFQ